MSPHPALSAPTLLTDGGLETSLIFLQGVELPAFAAFPLLTTEEGRRQLAAYFEPYLRLAAETGIPFVLDTPTWRVSTDWGRVLGYDRAALEQIVRDAVAFARELRDRFAPGHDVVIDGVIGPRADGYTVSTTMTAEESREFFAPYVSAFAAAGADLVSAVTMTYPAEGAGVALAARAAGVPVVVSFTVETDGRLPSGDQLGAAIELVDAQTDGYPLHYMINCAHPSHFAALLERGDKWADRVRGIRANASRRSHAELDAATDLDAGDPAELAAEYRALRLARPGIRVFGGCCGTDARHVRAIAEACSAPR